MFVDFTEEELEARNKLRAEWKEKIKNQPKDSSEPVTLRYYSILREFDKRCQKRRFDELNNNPDLILEDAKRQIDGTISWLYDQLETANNSSSAPFSRIGTTIDGVFKLNGTMVADIVRGHLSFHFEAFKDNEELSNKLSALIVDAVRDSKYTTEIDISQITEELESGVPDVIQAELPRIIAQQTEAFDYPLDKPNSLIWDLLTVTDPDGQLTINFDTSKKGSGKEALIYYSIDFSELENQPGLKITKRLTPFDKRVYIIAAALFNAGNEVITASQIYRADHSGEPGDDDINKINDSLTKMVSAHIYIDNKREINAKMDYPHFKYDAPLLPFERVSAYINGQLSESAIHLFREPPLITFARERKQITTIDRKVLLSPLSKTDANLRIEDYLIERISRIKVDKHAKRKLLYATIFEKCGITEKKQKQRAPGKIKRFLDHYKDCELIRDFAETKTKDGIEIKL